MTSLADKVARVKELDAEYQRCEKLWPMGSGTNKQTAIICLNARRGLTNHSPQMAELIAEQDAIIQKQREVLGMAREALESLEGAWIDNVPMQKVEQAITAIDNVMNPKTITER